MQVIEFDGNTHEKGGIRISKWTEVEGGEVMVNGYVFSDRLTLGGKKNASTFADRAKKIINKYKDREYDPLALKQLEREINSLRMAQEMYKKAEGVENPVRTGDVDQMPYGGIPGRRFNIESKDFAEGIYDINGSVYGVEGNEFRHVENIPARSFSGVGEGVDYASGLNRIRGGIYRGSEEGSKEQELTTSSSDIDTNPPNTVWRDLLKFGVTQGGNLFNIGRGIFSRNYDVGFAPTYKPKQQQVSYNPYLDTLLEQARANSLLLSNVGGGGVSYANMQSMFSKVGDMAAKQYDTLGQMNAQLAAQNEQAKMQASIQDNALSEKIQDVYARERDSRSNAVQHGLSNMGENASTFLQALDANKQLRDFLKANGQTADFKIFFDKNGKAIIMTKIIPTNPQYKGEFYFNPNDRKLYRMGENGKLELVEGVTVEQLVPVKTKTKIG